MDDPPQPPPPAPSAPELELGADTRPRVTFHPWLYKKFSQARKSTSMFRGDGRALTSQQFLEMLLAFYQTSTGNVEFLQAFEPLSKSAGRPRRKHDPRRNPDRDPSSSSTSSPGPQHPNG